MIRFLLFLLFSVLLLADTLGLNLSLAPGLSVKNAFLYMLLLGIAINTALARNRRLELLSVVIPYGVVILFAIFSWLVMILLVQHPEYNALGTLINLKGGLADHLLVFLVFFYGVLNSRDTLSLIKWVLWIVIAVNIISVIDYLNLPNLDIVTELEDGRLRGPIDEPNQYASYLSLFIPAIAGLCIIERGVSRLLAVLGFAFSMLALLMTASRGGMVGLIGGSLAGTFWLRRYISGRHIMIGIVGVCFLGVVATMILHFAGVAEMTYGRLIGQTTSGNAFDISSGRTLLWAEALGEMLDHPYSLITGFGWDAYRQIGAFRMAPHNSFLKIFFELGIIGLILVVVAFWNVLSIARASLASAEGEARVVLFAFTFGLLGFLAAIFFVDIYSPWIFSWAFVGLAMRLAVLQQEVPARSPERVTSFTPLRSRDVAEPG